MTKPVSRIQPSYPAARAVAPKIHAHFVRHLDEERGATGRPAPEIDAIEMIIDRAFWASLRREDAADLPAVSV